MQFYSPYSSVTPRPSCSQTPVQIVVVGGRRNCNFRRRVASAYCVEAESVGSCTALTSPKPRLGYPPKSQPTIFHALSLQLQSFLYFLLYPIAVPSTSEWRRRLIGRYIKTYTHTHTHKGDFTPPVELETFGSGDPCIPIIAMDEGVVYNRED